MKDEDLFARWERQACQRTMEIEAAAAKRTGPFSLLEVGAWLSPAVWVVGWGGVG